MRCSYEQRSVLGCWRLTKQPNVRTDNILNTAKVSKHVWTKKKQAVGKLTVEVAKWITSPPVHRVAKCKAWSLVMGTRPDSSSGRCGAVRCGAVLLVQLVHTAHSKGSLDSCEVSNWRRARPAGISRASAEVYRSGHWKPLLKCSSKCESHLQLSPPLPSFPRCSTK